MRKLWPALILGRSPFRRFFWTPAGLIPNPVEELDCVAGAGGKGDIRHQKLLPDGEHACYVAQVAPGKVIGDVTLVSTWDDIVLGDQQALHGVKDPAAHWVMKRCRFRRPRSLAGTAMVLAATSGANYFHWLFESLPRLRLLEMAGFDLGAVDWFLLNQYCSGFHNDALDELRVPVAKRLRCFKQEVLEVGRLVVVSPHAPPGSCPVWVCDFLREEFLRPQAGPSDRKIYISRRQAHRRRLVGEEQVLPWLERRGFEIVCLEQMSFRMQVDLFASARIVVGVHGAAMANLVFMRPGGTVLELLAPDYPQFCYRELANKMKLEHRHAMGEAVRQRVKDPTMADVFLSPQALKRHVEAAGF